MEFIRIGVCFHRRAVSLVGILLPRLCGFPWPQLVRISTLECLHERRAFPQQTTSFTLQKCGGLRVDRSRHWQMGRELSTLAAGFPFAAGCKISLCLEHLVSSSVCEGFGSLQVPFQPWIVPTVWVSWNFVLLKCGYSIVFLGPLSGLLWRVLCLIQVFYVPMLF